MDIRKLDIEDIDLVRSMDTGIKNDYVIHVFTRLTEGKICDAWKTAK